MRFGLDFGTSNSSLAVWAGGRATVLPLDALAGPAMPSILYVRRDGESLVGRGAIDAYLADNRARGPLRREFQMLGLRVASSDPEQPTVEAHIYTDLQAPGRLFQALKTFLGDPLETSTNVFGTSRGLSELVAIVLAHIRKRAKALTEEAPAEVTIGRPVEFVGGRAVESRALERLGDAARLAGFREVRFVMEPVAAARSADVAMGTSLVFDFGGGTLDLCIVTRDAAGVAVRATAGRDIGGDRFTELLIDETVAAHLGSRAEWGPKQLRLPRYITNALRDWHALSALNEKPLLDALDDLVRAGAPRRELAALRSAIELQLGYEIFSTVDAAKCTLSSEGRALLSFHHGEVDIDAQIARGRFEHLIAASLKAIDELLGEALARAGVAEDRIVEVVCTGGSSAIPSVRALLARRFGSARVRDADLFTSVAAGLAFP